MPYTSENVTIISTRWTSNAPAIYLTLQYTAEKDLETGKHRNRDTINGTYTLNDLTLTVSMPGKSSYFGYTVGAQILSGSTELTSQVQLKGSSPQYWDFYKFNFGNVVVRNLSISSDSFPITLKMITNCPATTYWTNYVLTQTANDAINQDIFGTLGVKTFDNVQHTYKQWQQYISAVGHNLDDPQYPSYNYYMTDPKFVVKTSGKLVEEERNTSYSNKVSAGVPYFLPDSLSYNILQLGGTSAQISFSVVGTYIQDFSNPLWRWRVTIQQGGSVIGTFYSENNSISYTISVFGLDPTVEYSMVAVYGDLESDNTKDIDGEIPTRFGFYVYINEELGWQWAIPYVYNNGWQECVPAIYYNNEWNTSAENNVADGGES